MLFRIQCRPDDQRRAEEIARELLTIARTAHLDLCLLAARAQLSWRTLPP